MGKVRSNSGDVTHLNFQPYRRHLKILDWNSWNFDSGRIPVIHPSEWLPKLIIPTFWWNSSLYSQTDRHTGTVPFSFFLFHFENLAKLVTQKNRKISRISTRKKKNSKNFPFPNFFVEKYPNFAKKRKENTGTGTTTRHKFGSLLAAGVCFRTTPAPP